MKREKISRYDQLSLTGDDQPRHQVGMWVRTNTGATRPRIEAEIPDPTSPKLSQRLDLSEWVAYKHLYEPFADGFVRWAPQRSPRTRIEAVKTLTLGWFAFLLSIPSGPEMQLGGITSTAINGFIVWLDQPTADGTARWSVATRMNRLGALREIASI